MEFGSQVYGTSLPTSDTDIKGVFLPTARDILLGTVTPTISKTTKQDNTARNTADDVDTELFSLQQYCKLLAEGQTVAVDMLFVPSKHYIDKCAHRIWREIAIKPEKFLHSGSASFVGYCRTQANKYGIKGSRVAAVRAAVEALSGSDARTKLHDPHVMLKLIDVISQHGEHASFVVLKGPNGEPAEHFECCNRKMPLTATVKYALGQYQDVLDKYGARALAAEANNGVDWKALSHAVRIANQAVELLTDHTVTFPRPEAALLLQIRKGELPYKQVAEMIEQGIVDVEAASAKSTLPKQADIEWIEHMLVDVYSEVIDEYRSKAS